MPRPACKRLKDNYAAIVATIALVVALTGSAAMASGLITGQQIKNGSITAADIKKAGLDAKVIGKNAVTASAIKADAVNSEEIQPDAVGTSDIGGGAVTSEQIGNGDVKSQDIGDGEVKPEDITEPAPVQIVTGSAAAAVAEEFAKVTDVGTYTKQDPTSVLSVNWSGTANAPTQSCVFQLRVDGQPAPNNAGLVYVAAGAFSTVSIASTALFSGLGTGSHTVEVWARAITGGSPGTDQCIIGPAEAGIPQTFVISEELT